MLRNMSNSAVVAIPSNTIGVHVLRLGPRKVSAKYGECFFRTEP